ncbi:MAG: GTPase Era [Armatimonadetes bacterium]|nr:GTPase Era [Armatimonadota bacterium]
MGFRSGAVALIGKPNVGKSTLVNLVVGQKVTIVSPRRQTTRHRIRGIRTESEHQLVLVDTPGIHEAHTHLGKKMNDAARTALGDVDLVLIVVDAHKPPDTDDKEIAGLLERAWRYPYADENPDFNGVLLCLNKMDMLKAEYVIENVEEYCKLFKTERYMLTCLTKKQNVDELVEMIVQSLPEGEPLYPEEMVTDQSLRQLAAELVREQAILQTKQEVPHAVATLVDLWEEDDEKVRIAMSIIVEKEGQKAILIGKGGSMLKLIGTTVRKELEPMMDKHVRLELHVKVREDWRQNPRMLQELEME